MHVRLTATDENGPFFRNQKPKDLVMVSPDVSRHLNKKESIRCFILWKRTALRVGSDEKRQKDPMKEGFIFRLQASRFAREEDQERVDLLGIYRKGRCTAHVQTRSPTLRDTLLDNDQHSVRLRLRG